MIRKALRGASSTSDHGSRVTGLSLIFCPYPFLGPRPGHGSWPCFRFIFNSSSASPSAGCHHPVAFFLTAKECNSHFDVSRILETSKHGLTGTGFPVDRRRGRGQVVYQLVLFLESGDPLTPSKLGKIAGRSVQRESGKR
jgi:hypothetical protein